MEIRKIKILAIDDNPDNLISLKALIKEAFPEAVIFTAISGEKGLQLAVNEDPDVILLDIVMPEMDGFEVCRKLKEDKSLSDIPVVFVTALKGNKESRIKALEYGGEAFLAKPIDESELTAQIRAMMKIKAANEQKRDEKKRLEMLVKERTKALQKELMERKRVENALRSSKEAYRRVIDNVDEIIYSVSLDGNAIGGTVNFVSGQATKILGYSPEEFILNSGLWFTLIHPDDTERIARQTNLCFENKKFETRTYRMRHKHTGEYLWLEDRPQFLFDEYGTIIGQYGTARDITERKQTEEELKKSEERFRGIFENSTVGIYRTSPEGKILLSNPALVKMLGYESLEELIKHDLGKDYYEPNYQRADFCRQIENDGEIIGLETARKRADNTMVYVRESAKVLRDSDGRVLYYDGIIEDITERKQMEIELLNSKIKAEESGKQLIIRNKELTERNRFIQTILDNLPIGISLNKIDEGTATYMNKKFEEIYGWNSDEITSIESFFDHVYPDKDYRDKLIRLVISDIQSGDPERMHWENIIATHRDGAERVINAVNIPLIEQNTMISTVTDITELHKTQIDLLAAKEKAEESDRLKSAFLANMSHEIRTPLNSIVGFSDLLLDPEFDQDQHAEFARMISNSGNSLLSIINDIMDISKIEAGQVQLHKSIFSVHKLIGDIQKEYSFKSGEKGIELRLDPLNPTNELFIQSDENRLKQILINFVGNAIKFTEKGFIEIGLVVRDHTLQIQVKDSGIGIPKEFHNKIFDRFTQVEAANKRKYGGNGLGLAISKSLVELLGGKIGMESEVGKGSIFYIIIPI